MDRPAGLTDRLPPEPGRRSITPAPEDYAARTPLRPLLVPLGWMGVVVLLVFLVSQAGWSAWTGGRG
ncbi:MAG: hypothetical protein ACYTG6_12105 [Planctomycetota bacterium]|jgi:hypothetical protein